jgi:hypothetical protein
MFTRTDVWEYVLQGRQEYGFCSRATDVCPVHIGCAYGPVVVCGGLSTRRNERQTVASERPVGIPSVCVRFTLQG